MGSIDKMNGMDTMDGIIYFDSRHIRIKKMPLHTSKKIYTTNWSSMHIHNCHELVIIESGKYAIKAPKVIYEGEGPCIVFFKLGVYHDIVRNCSESEPYIAHVLQFKQNVEENISKHPICSQGYFDKGAFVIPIDENDLEPFLSLLTHIEKIEKDEESVSEDSVSVMEMGFFVAIVNYVYELIIEGKAHSFDSFSEDTFYISEIIRTMIENVEKGKPVSITEFAEHFHVSCTKLSRDFYRITGMTMKQLLVSLKIDKIKNLLAEGRTNAEVAEKCGFSNVDYMIQFFKKHMKISPGAYRKAVGLRHTKI